MNIDKNNIKRIIFDLDDTLIDWKDEYWNSLNRTFEELNIKYSNEDIEKAKNALSIYEDGRNKRHDREKLRLTMCQELKYDLPENFIDIWLKYLGKCIPKEIDNETINTLEYLKDKYELVILSNWFEKSQIERLKNSGLIKYFKETYFDEKIDMKPSKEAFNTAIGPFKLDECIMVGDNIDIDILGAVNNGINAIYLNKKNNKLSLNNDNIKIINKISKLIEIL